jgi:hypothetical protein
LDAKSLLIYQMILNMKNIFTLLVAGLLGSSAFANNITLTLPANNGYQVLIDGSNVNGNNYSNNTVYLSNLQYGQHSIEVYRIKSGLFGNKRSLVYSTAFNSSPQYDLDITVDNNGRVQMYQSANNSYGKNGRGNNQGGYGNNGNWEKKKHKDRDRDGDDDDDRGSRNGNYGNNGGYDNRGNNGGYNNNNYRQPMNDYDFNQFLQGIQRQWTGKLSSARNGISSNYFSTYQVKQVLQLFSSESDRLDLAKVSYRNLVDQQNFRQLYNLFSYQGQSELDRYIQSGRY